MNEESDQTNEKPKINKENLKKLDLIHKRNE